MDGVEDEDVYLSRPGNKEIQHASRQGPTSAQSHPGNRTAQALQLLKNWWVDTQQYTRSVVLDPDYHVPVGL